VAILILAGGTELDTYVVRRLLAQGDEVRVLEKTAARREEWRGLGAFLAVGEADDPDLVERAAQSVRTVVLLEDPARPEVIANVLEAAPKAGVDRVVVCGAAIDAHVREALGAGDLSHVIIETARPGLLRRKAASPELVAEAVDAADDLAGDPRMNVDLTKPEGRKLLDL
jgi:hypothetical protein